MAISSQNDKLIVAIYGGGVTCATLSQALKDQIHLDVQYFDPNPDPTSVTVPFLSLYPQAHDALAFIGKEAGATVEKVGWFAEAPSLVVMGQGSDAGTTVCDLAGFPRSSSWPEVVVVQPAAFLKEMLGGLVPEALHTNKKLVSVTHSDRSAHPLDIHFEDGSTHHVDVLIGDDGPMGVMRSLVIGSDHSATKPVFEGYLTAVCMVPPEENIAQYLDPSYAAKDAGRRFERIGNKSWVNNENSLRAILGTFYTDEDYNVSQPLRSTTSEELQEHFKDFEGGAGITDALTKFSGLRLIPEIAHPHAPTYINGLVAMAGNAAHKMTNFQQLHFGQQIEDAMILGALLREAKNLHGVAAALYAYDVVRRPQSQWVSDQAKYLGELWHGMADGVGLDVARLKAAFEKWWKEWREYDVKEHRQDALRLMRERLWAAGYVESRE
nr:Hydroxylase [Shiraia sp. slf14]